MTAPVPPSGQLIAGRYEVRRALGAGAFGEVFEVLDHFLDSVCALKLHKQVAAGPWTEAQILRQLEGEHILKVLNADVASGVPYVVTDLATHGTIADQIQPGVGVEVAAAVRWARQACQGVARIHDQMLLHRDIKPENLFLDDRRDVLVGDLGLAQLRDNNGLADAAGSIPTMAPEVAQVGVPGQHPATTRTYRVESDVYSIFATLFWMLAGAPPIPGAATVSDAWSAPRPDLWDEAPHVPQGLRDIVNRSIDGDPNSRYASAADLDSALGGRALPARVWTRIRPHTGHEQCFTGAKGSSNIEICSLPNQTHSRLAIVARHAISKREIVKAQRTVTRSRLPAGLRSAFHACG